MASLRIQAPSGRAPLALLRWFGVAGVHLWALSALWQTPPAPVASPNFLRMRLLPSTSNPPPPAEQPTPRRPPSVPPRPAPAAAAATHAAAVPVHAADLGALAEPFPAPPSPVPAAPLPAPMPPAAAPIETIPPRFAVGHLDNPAPVYPALSRRLGEQGRVLLLVAVGTDGQARAVAIEHGSGYPRLDTAAADAVRRWTFIPAHRDGLALAANVLVPITFSLKD